MTKKIRFSKIKSRRTEKFEVRSQKVISLSKKEQPKTTEKTARKFEYGFLASNCEVIHLTGLHYLGVFLTKIKLRTTGINVQISFHIVSSSNSKFTLSFLITYHTPPHMWWTLWNLSWFISEIRQPKYTKPELHIQIFARYVFVDRTNSYSVLLIIKVFFWLQTWAPQSRLS